MASLSASRDSASLADFLQLLRLRKALIALILAAGLGLDYALFFEHAADDPHEQRRTLHAVLVCSLSTLMVFALLATSSLPVLRAIGLTVSLGVVSNFVLALLLTREAPKSQVHPGL